MRKQRTIGNGASTNQLIADGLDFVVDPQVTSLQLWNVIICSLRGFDVVGSIKHDLYPFGFTGVVLLLDGHIAAQYGVDGRQGKLNLTLCSNAGATEHERLRSHLYDVLRDIQP